MQQKPQPTSRLRGSGYSLDPSVNYVPRPKRKTIEYGISNKENLWSSVWLLFQTRSWCQASETKKKRQRKEFEPLLGLGQNPLSLGNRVHTVSGLPDLLPSRTQIATMLLIFDRTCITMGTDRSQGLAKKASWRLCSVQTRSQLPHRCSVMETSLTKAVYKRRRITVRSGEAWARLSPCRCIEAALHHLRAGARSMSLTTGTRSNICVWENVHSSPQSLTHCVAPSGSHSSSSSDIRRETSDLKPTSFGWCCLKTTKQQGPSSIDTLDQRWRVSQKTPGTQQSPFFMQPSCWFCLCGGKQRCRTHACTVSTRGPSRSCTQTSRVSWARYATCGAHTCSEGELLLWKEGGTHGHVSW